MNNIIKQINKFLYRNDPVKNCDLYKKHFCAHIDGQLCNYPSCSLLKNYYLNNFKYFHEIKQ